MVGAKRFVTARTNIPQDFLDYRIEEPIGQGGMGVVYLAHDVRLGRRVALKVMAPSLARDGRYRASFARESELAMSLEHPNVVPIHDAGEAEGRLYLAMRRVEGSDLRALLRREGALDPARALAIVSQIAQALDAAHAKGLVHRDVKPSNVLLDDNEHVYLADFGLTRRLSEGAALQAEAATLGTPAYLAPEQIEGGEIDGRADVYSLGCLLYECLTSEPPFPGDSRLAVAWAHLEQAPPAASERRPELPGAVDGVIRRAMAKDPADRYPTCAELAAAAENALIPRARHRRRWALAAAGVAAAVVAGLLFAVLGRGGAAAEEALAPRANTIVRIDPRNNEISDVIHVGSRPNDVAVADGTVWAFNLGDNSVVEVDPRTDKVRHTTRLPIVSTDVGFGNGPLLAADARGAWMVGYDLKRGRSSLVRIPRGGRGMRAYSYGLQLFAVAAGADSIWLLGRGVTNGFVLRVDPVSGRVVARRPLPSWMFGSEGEGLAVGGGFVWVTNATAARVYRLDFRTGEARSARFGGFLSRPTFGFGRLWLCKWDGERGLMVRVDPRTLRNELERDALPAETGHFAVGFGSLWRHDVPSGTVMRFSPHSGDPDGLIPLLKRRPGGPSLDVSSLSTGAGAVWLSLSTES
jgi:streptogramin lyase